MTDCHEIQLLFDDWMDDEIGRADLERMMEHLGKCEACRTVHARWSLLKKEMLAFRGCAERVAGGARPRKKRIWFRSEWKAAAAILIVVTLAWSIRNTGRGGRHEMVQPPMAQMERAHDVIQVADAGEVVIDHPSHEMAVQFASKRSDLKIIWLYAPVPEAVKARPTSAPQS